MQKNYKIDLVLNFHGEGYYAQKSIRAALLVLEEAKKKKINAGLIGLLDRPDELTRRVVNTHKDSFNQLKEVNYGSAGLSRNEAARISDADIVSYCDGDDFYGLDWIVSCRDFLESNDFSKKYILRPHFVLSYGRKFNWFQQIDQESESFDTSCYLSNNPYCSPSMVWRETILKFPYKRDDELNGFGYEDWQWHADTTAAGFIHKIVPNSAYFYRAKMKNSLLVSSQNKDISLNRSELFEDLEFLSKRRVLDAKKYFHYKQVSIPASIISVMEVMSEVERDIAPEVRLINALTPYFVPGTSWCDEYIQLRSEVRGWEDAVCVFAPWIKRGGADLGLIYYCQALVRKGNRVLVFTTEDSRSEWASKLPEKNVKLIEFGAATRSIEQSEKMQLLLRLLIQIQPTRIWIVNSPLMWDLMLQHGKKIKSFAKIFVSLFCEDRTYLHQPRSGYPYSHFAHCMENVDALITDNIIYKNKWNLEFGYEFEKIFPVHFPAEKLDPFWSKSKEDTKKVLWAGRVDAQKNPEMVLNLSLAMPDVQFHIFGAAHLNDSSVLIKKLKERPNVHIRGSFDGLRNLIESEYFDLFLNTSLWDGVPHVLLDSGSCGIPIVTTDVGGITDLLSDSSSFLVKSPFNVEEFANNIREALSNTDLIMQKRQNCIEVIKTRTFKNFAEELELVPGLL